MQHIPQSKATVHESDAMTAWEYDAQSRSMNLALIQIDGRYPEKGFTSNTVVDSLIQIVEGDGVLGGSDGTIFKITRGDQIHLAANDAYFFKGNLEIVYVATPGWTPEQTKHID